MSPPAVIIVRTGGANLASVSAAFTRLGVAIRLSDNADEIAFADRVVLPGVGHFGPVMTGLRNRGIDRAIVDRLEQGRSLLAICLGMQLLCDASDEASGVPGMGVIPGHISRFPTSVRVPQMGWNQIIPTGQPTTLEPAFVYFANSYRLPAIPTGWAGAISDHAGPFVAALERRAPSGESLLACQFHPELSGAAGLHLLRQWLGNTSQRQATRC